MSLFYLQLHRWINRDLQTLEEVSEHESVPLLLRFLRTSKPLRDLELDWDNGYRYFNTAVTKVTAFHLCDLTMRNAALNSNITRLTLNRTVQYPLSALAYLIETTSSITTLNIAIGHESDDEVDGSNPLVTAFGLNQSIQDLTLDYCACKWHIVTSILKQMESHLNLLRLSLVRGTDFTVWHDGDDEDDGQSTVFAAVASLLKRSILMRSLSFKYY